ncbi:MAG: T9SS type A sorting domain-containing protein [Flavobacteriales bacterium]|nr:T9SS type A sorting domain-containing protein [Flavobacteriales bacterium]
MKSLLFPLALLLTGPSIAQFAPGNPENISQFEQHPATGPRSGGLPTRGYDMHYLRCIWNIDPAVRYISGTVTSYFSATADIDQVQFDLSDSLVVDAVTVHGIPATYTQIPGDQLIINLGGTLSTGALDSVSVTYHGVPPNTGFGSFVTGYQNSVPVMWTLSEPYGASDWWPAKEDNNDKVDSMDAYVTVPEGYRSAGNGALASETTAGGFTTCHWKHRYPIDHYLIATAVTNYMTDTRQMPLVGDTVTFLTYAYPADFGAAWANTNEVEQQILFYSQLLGNYPFADEKYGHAQFGWGGGMEHQTMTFVSGYFYDLAAHELAHQWFGDKVTCGSWAHIWLNEGFATYMTGLCHENLIPDSWQQWKQDKIDNITEYPDGSVFCTDTNNIGRLFSGRLTYNKGAMVLHTLRWVVGDSAFFQGLRNYLDDPELAYGTALTADLQAHLEATSGMDLTGFFADWFMGEGYPIYTATYFQDAQGNVTVSLSQTQSHPSVDFFELPVPIRFSGGGVDSTVVFNNTSNGQQFNFHLPFTVQSTAFDPELWLISANDIVTEVGDVDPGAAQLLPYPNPTGNKLAWRTVGTQAAYRTATLLNAVGQRCLEADAAAGTVDVQHLPPGGYVLELKGAEGVLRARFVKE